jgi:hypothetical protein
LRPLSYHERWQERRVNRLYLIVSVPFLACISLLVLRAAPPQHQTENVILVMTDGFRWQELFRGADPALMTIDPKKANEGKAIAAFDRLKKNYWRDTPGERRQALMPFLWGTIAKNGQIYGNRDLGSDAHVTNGLNFSYPGYNETLCGFADPAINSNDEVLNPNVTVLEWLNRKPEFRGKVAAFGAWDLFPFIFNQARAGFTVNAGYEPLTVGPITPRLELLNQLKADGPRVWSDEAFDAPTFYTALEYLKIHQPRVLYLSLGETDDWAHDGNYPEYLNAAHRADEILKRLWEAAQSMPQYKGRTTLIFSPDHGRGTGTIDWTGHGRKIADSKNIWMAFIGPDTEALGERSRIPEVTQNQIAATLAALLGQDYNKDVSKAGAPIADVLHRAVNRANVK